MSKAKPAIQAERQAPVDAQPPATPEIVELKLPHAEQDKLDEIQAHKNMKRWPFDWSAFDLTKVYYFGRVFGAQREQRRHADGGFDH